MLFSKVISLASLFISGVWAQTEMAQCQPGFEWNRNSQNQDACLIGSKLDAACRGLVVYNYPPLNSSQYYLPPRTDHPGDLTCDCNTVMYSLYMECTLCQGAQIYSWTDWIAACVNITIAGYPSIIPQGTPIPRWTFYNVTLSTNQTYNESNAISIGRDPEEMPPPVSISSSSVPIDTSTAPIDSSSVPIDSSSVPIDTSTVPIDTSTVPIDTSTVPIDTSIVPISTAGV